MKYKADMSDAGWFYKKAKQLDIWAEGDTRGLAGLVSGYEPLEGETIIEKRFV